MITMSFTTAIVIALLFVYRKAVKKTAKAAEDAINVAATEMQLETMVLAKAHRQNVAERLIELREEAQENNLDSINLTEELEKFRKEYGIKNK